MSNFKQDNPNMDNSKKREYLKQQHQLRTMTKTNSAISADDMIENLLSNKEIFQKKRDQNAQSSPGPSQSQSAQWPIWVMPGKEPQVYKQFWSQVGLPNGLADTTKTSSLLLTSRLTTDTLGYIWSLTNLTIPGSLTQQELYISLALVALAQNGYTFTNANVVKQLLEAPMPKLDLSLGEMPSFSGGLNPVASTGIQQQPIGLNVPTVTETLSLLDISSEPVSLLESSPTKSLSVLSATDLSKDFPSLPSHPDESLIFGDFQTNDDDFDDFKDAFMTNMNNLTVLDVKDLLPSLDEDKTPQTSILDLNQLQPENDSKPKEEKAYVEDLFPKCIQSKPDEKPQVSQPLPVLPAVEEDRYSALRVLESSQETQEFDEFGDFLTAESSEPSFQADQTDVQLKCLEACISLLKEAVNIFESIENPKVLEEVMSDERGQTYLDEIVQVERIGRRIRANRENSSSIGEFESLSQALQPFIQNAQNTMEEQEGPKCGLCFMEYGPAHIKYGINHFHAPCANLYLQKVDAILPIAPVM